MDNDTNQQTGTKHPDRSPSRNGRTRTVSGTVPGGIGGSPEPDQGRATRAQPGASERLIKWSTATAVLWLAAVAAVVSYEHAYALVRRYGEQGWTARLVPLTVDGLNYASSMVMLHCARHRIPVPRLARWLLGLGIAATLAANATHGLGYGVAGAVIAAWPAVALVGHTPNTAVPAERPAVPADRPMYPDVPEPVAVPDPLRVRALEEFGDEVANGSVPSIRRIRSRLRVGQPKAQDIANVRFHEAQIDPITTDWVPTGRRITMAVDDELAPLPYAGQHNTAYADTHYAGTRWPVLLEKPFAALDTIWSRTRRLTIPDRGYTRLDQEAGPYDIAEITLRYLLAQRRPVILTTREPADTTAMSVHGAFAGQFQGFCLGVQ